MHFNLCIARIVLSPLTLVDQAGQSRSSSASAKRVKCAALPESVSCSSSTWQCGDDNEVLSQAVVRNRRYNFASESNYSSLTSLHDCSLMKSI